MTSSKRKQASAPAADDQDTPVIKYTCDSCFRDISSIVRAQCALCDDIDLCVECLASGQSLPKQHHQPAHPYRILRPFGTAVYAGDWRADEDLLLLEGLETCGMGNWEDIAEMMGGRRTKEDCAARYHQIYLDWAGAPHPNRDRELAAGAKHLELRKKPRLEAASPATPVGGYHSFPANHEITGFMPLRSEFETVFDNDAELSIKDLAFLEGEAPTERSLKRCMLDIYTGTLDRRAARFGFAHQHGLLAAFKQQQAIEKLRSSKEEKDTWQAVRPFARFCVKSDFDEFYRGLVREAELRKRILQLQEYRRGGIRRTDEVARYESEKKHLELYLRSGGSAIIHRPVKEPHPLVGSPRVLVGQQQSPGAGTPTPQEALSSSFSTGRKASTPLNINHADGIELLTEKERDICSILRLFPRVYLHIKDTLIKEYLEHRGLKRAQARAAVKIDVNKTSRLYDFFVSAGWIKPPPGGDQ